MTKHWGVMCSCSSIIFSRLLSLEYLSENNIYPNINHREVHAYITVKSKIKSLACNSFNSTAHRSHLINSCNRWFQAQVSYVWGPNHLQNTCGYVDVKCFWCRPGNDTSLEEPWAHDLGLIFCLLSQISCVLGTANISLHIPQIACSTFAALSLTNWTDLFALDIFRRFRKFQTAAVISCQLVPMMQFCCWLFFIASWNDPTYIL